MEQFLHDNQPIPSADQPRLFKLLVALRTAAKFPDNAIARSALEERVVRERETAEGLQDWRMPDLVRLAEGSVQWVPDSSESIHSQTSKYSLLSSIYALGLVQRTSVETLRARHAELRDRLTMSNVRLVSHYVRPFARGGSMSYADLFQEGAIGLMRAVDRFD